MLDIAEIEKKAIDYRQQLGGKYFAFPVDPFDSASKYAIVVFTVDHFHTFPHPLTVEEAAAGLRSLIEEVEQEIGRKVIYDQEVRFISYAAQMDGPNITMRRLKKSGEFTCQTGGYLKRGEDVTESEEVGETKYLFTGRGLVKFSYLLAVDEKFPKAERFMDGYYRLLALHKYGKAVAEIRREVQRMSKDDAIRWIERTYERYIHNDTEVFDLMKG